MTQHHMFIILFLLAGILCTSGCSGISDLQNHASGHLEKTGPSTNADNRHTLAQPEDTAMMIKMDTDIYNLGEVVEFTITNEKTMDLICSHNPPSFSVLYQKATGQWVTRMGDGNQPPGNKTTLKPAESTNPYRFVTTGWAPGRYRIDTDCGVSREILIRALPLPTPSAPSCPPKTNTSPFIRVDPISDQQAGEPFAITGTTNLPAGEVLRYSIFAIVTASSNITSAKLVSSTITVTAGECGINTWYVDGVIRIPGDYFIGISSEENTVSAVKRFSVLGNETRPAETRTLPQRINTPGITTGKPPEGS